MDRVDSVVVVLRERVSRLPMPQQHELTISVQLHDDANEDVRGGPRGAKGEKKPLLLWPGSLPLSLSL